MEKKIIEKFNFIGRIALEYRLSLKNVCKLMGNEPTKENKENIYALLIESTEGNTEIINLYNNLFSYETINEPETIEKESYLKALTFNMAYNRALATQDSDKINATLKLLNKTDDDFKKLKYRSDLTELSKEDVEVITKYRIKYGISRIVICDELRIGKDGLRGKERYIANETLKYKLKQLSEFLNSIKLQRDRRKRW